MKGDIAGSQTFNFTSNDALHLTRQLGIDVKPYLLSFKGRATRLAPDRGLTERQRTTLTFLDDPDAPAFDPAVFTVTTGGSFFKRLVIAQPDFVSSKVEIKRGFVSKGFLESDFEVIFKGTLEDIDFQKTGNVSLVVKENSPFIDRQVPPEISDNNVLETILSVDTSSFDVTSGVQITDPADLDSKDFMPIILRIKDEDIIIKSITNDTIEVQDNFLKKTEAFEDSSIWLEVGVGFRGNKSSFNPFGGGLTVSQMTTNGTATGIKQNSLAVAGSDTYTFSIWLKSATGVTGNVLLRIEDGANVGTSSNKSVTGEWQRVELTHAFAGGTGNVTVFIVEAVGGITEILLFGAQLEKSSTRGFYVGVNTDSGAIAGRGAFGSTKTTAVIGINFKEVVIVKQHLDELGISPIIALRDLMNRGETKTEDIDLDSFNTELNFNPFLQCARAKFLNLSDTVILKPKNLLSLIKEIRSEFLIDLWMSETGKFKVRFSFKPLIPHKTAPLLTDKANIIQGSLSIKGNKERRVTRVFVYYGRISSEKDDRKPEGFNNVFVETEAGINIRWVLF